MPGISIARTVAIALAAISLGCPTTRFQVRGAMPEMEKPIKLDELEADRSIRMGTEARCIEKYQHDGRSRVPVRLGIIEISEQGVVNTLQKQQVFKMVEDGLDSDPDRGVVVVAFIHGWHHGAGVCDSNLMNFRNVLVNGLARNLDRQVIGVYFAWRGESVDRPKSFRPLTFYNRKRTAERIGNTGAVEALFQLEALVKRDREDGKGCALNTMITVGHSFGGGLLFSAVRRKMIGTDSDGRQFVRGSDDPTGGNGGDLRSRASFGDLAILLNPAIEADLYRPFHDDLLGQHFETDQAPVLVTFASTTDKAVGVAFPASRFIRLLYHPWWPFTERGRSNLRAIGHFGPQVTHYLSLADQTPTSAKAAKKDPNVCSQCKCDPGGFYEINVGSDLQRGVKQETYKRFSAEQSQVSVAAREYELKPRSISRELGADPRFPYMVVRASGKLLPGHNGIFNPDFVNFLLDYVTSITDKQFEVFLKTNPGCASKTAY